MSTNKLTPGQLGCIHALVNKLKLQHLKEEMVRGFSGGRASSTADLYVDEAAAYIKHLKAQDPEEKAAEKMRRKIISMAHECGYRKPGTTVIDMVKLDAWCVKYGHKHKKLNQYRYADLPKLVTQFQNMYKQFLSSY